MLHILDVAFFWKLDKFLLDTYSGLRACAYVSRELQLPLKTLRLLNFAVLVPLGYSARSTKARGRSVRLCTSALYLTSLVGPSGLEPPTSCLSGTRSNLLSYEPMW